MLKVGIECSYNNRYKAKDLYGARYYMQELFRKNGIELTRISIAKFNEKEQKFSEYNIYRKNGTVKRIQEKYNPDIIRNRKGNCTLYKYAILKKFFITSSQRIATLANDKYETSMFLGKYQPKTFLLSTVLKNKYIQKKYVNKMVIKPIRSNGGKGIEQTSIEELLKNKDKYIGLEELYIVQEFKDFSKGYPGIVEGIHDVRFMFAGKEIIETTLRIPAAGNFKSNIGSGGKQFAINLKQIPQALRRLAKKVYKKISDEQKDIFSIDFAFCSTDQKRYVLEINTSPGTRYYQTDKQLLHKVCMGLVKFFKKIEKGK